VNQNKKTSLISILKDLILRNLPFCSTFLVSILIIDIYAVKLAEDTISQMRIYPWVIGCLLICFTSVNYNLTSKIENILIRLVVSIGIGILFTVIYSIVALTISVNFRLSIGGDL